MSPRGVPSSALPTEAFCTYRYRLVKGKSLQSTATKVVPAGPYVPPQADVQSVGLMVRVQDLCQASYPWVDPTAWYPAATSAPGTSGYLLLTERGPRFVFRWHFEAVNG